MPDEKKEGEAPPEETGTEAQAAASPEPATEAPATPAPEPTPEAVLEAGSPRPGLPPEPKRKKHNSDDAGRRARDQRALIGLGIAVLVLLIIGASFGIGFAVGDYHEGSRTLLRNRLQNGMGPGQRLRRFRENAQGMMQNGEASVIRGTVAAVDANNLTVQTSSGNQTVSLSANTKYLGAAGGNGGSNTGVSLAVGEQVQVFARKTADGKLEAVLIRVGSQALQSSQPGQ